MCMTLRFTLPMSLLPFFVSVMAIESKVPGAAPVRFHLAVSLVCSPFPSTGTDLSLSQL